MDLFKHLKTIEHSSIRWAYEDEFRQHMLSGFPIEELSFIDKETSTCSEENSFRRCYFGADDYPKNLYSLFDPPWSLSLEGPPCDINSIRWLSVVGTREPSGETIEWMNYHLTQFLRRHPCGIVSGGARGIDMLAHEIALREGCPTLFVLPSGLQQVYPNTLHERKKRIIDKGGVFLSEYSDGQLMKKYLFSHRNRLIAALSSATLVVQASEKSGTLMTAHRALEMGRPLYVVPGHPMQNSFKGSSDLLREGAQILICAEDLISFFSTDSILPEKSNKP